MGKEKGVKSWLRKDFQKKKPSLGEQLVVIGGGYVRNGRKKSVRVKNEKMGDQNPKQISKKIVKRLESNRKEGGWKKS